MGSERYLDGSCAFSLTLKHVLDSDLLAAAGKPVGNGKNGAKIVRGVAPLGSEEAIVEVEPPDHGADIEGSTNRIKLIGSTRNLWCRGEPH